MTIFDDSISVSVCDAVNKQLLTACSEPAGNGEEDKGFAPQGLWHSEDRENQQTVTTPLETWP